MSRSGASGWTSGKQAPPIVKSQPAEMKAASSAALPSPPSGCSKSSCPRGGSPRSAKTFSIPAAAIRSRVAASPSVRLADAAQVGHRLEAQVVLQRPGDLDRPLAGRPAGAVGHRDEVGLQLAQLAGRREQPLGRLRRLRREELDREGRPPRGEDLVDAHPRQRSYSPSQLPRGRAALRLGAPLRPNEYPVPASAPRLRLISIAQTLPSGQVEHEVDLGASSWCGRSSATAQPRQARRAGSRSTSPPSSRLPPDGPARPPCPSRPSRACRSPLSRT